MVIYAYLNRFNDEGVKENLPYNATTKRYVRARFGTMKMNESEPLVKQRIYNFTAGSARTCKDEDFMLKKFTLVEGQRSSELVQVKQPHWRDHSPLCLNRN